MIKNPPHGLWRNVEAYQRLLAGGRRAVAWELLRRDPNYCVEAATRNHLASAFKASDPACLARWGLLFRL